MQIQTDFPLRKLNTFGIEAYARYFASFSSSQELEELLSDDEMASSHPFILGGGSNILWTKNPQVVWKNEVKGIEQIGEDNEHVYVKAGAGENWHQFVMYCIEQHWAGLENLSLIPGNTGASPMQNIGAYGVEVKDVFHSLEAFHLQDKIKVVFTKEDCKFGYRDSVFKHQYKGRFVMMNITYRLDKRPHFNTSYGAIEKELEEMGVKALTLKTVSRAVINIRSSKLPDPAKIGNAGSFFKNPEVSLEKYEQLKNAFPGIKAYPVGDQYKLAAAWLIEQCGWKGYREGDAGVHKNQALVLVNYGHASGAAIYALSEKIQESVLRKFGVALEREVNVV